MSDDPPRHVYPVTETVEHTVVADRPLTGPEIKRAVDHAREGRRPEPGVEVRLATASTWHGTRPSGDAPAQPAATAPIVDAVDDSYD